MSNLTFVNDALSLIGVLPEGVDATAEQGELAIRTVDEMVDEWQDDGIVVGWSPASSLDDDCSVRGLELMALKYHLAIRLSPHFGREPPGVLVALASGAYAKLQRRQMVSEMQPASLSLPAAEGDVGGGWNILTDS